MDVMKIHTSFMRGLISKLIGITIKNKFGYNVQVKLDSIDIRISDDVAHVNVNGGFDMKVDELKKIENIIGGDKE